MHVQSVMIATPPFVGTLTRSMGEALDGQQPCGEGVQLSTGIYRSGSVCGLQRVWWQPGVSKCS